MAENTSGISDVVQKGAKVANTVKSAAKLGKSIAAAAKGGAAGGWVGALAAFAWENRRLVAAIIIGSVVILLIPVVIVSMLPSLIFGGTNNTYSPTDTDNPILNSPVVINENMEEITISIENILTESLNLTLEEIEQDKATLSADMNVDIIYPTVDEDNYNKSLLISQYCASKDKDYYNISISDFENVLTQHKEKYYRYEKKEELRPVETVVTVVDATTGEETTNVIFSEELFTVYNVFYNGDDYFADNIFNLSAEQKELAVNYSESLNLFLSGGI